MQNIPGEVDLLGKDLSSWLDEYRDDDTVSRAEGLPVRRDMVTVLTYVRDTKVVGTQSTGNMPLKHVREVTSRFVDPPELDTSIGDQVYKLRTEFDVWPLYFLHILADVGGLVVAEPGRQWRLTSEGETFLDLDPLQQVVFLLSVWWFEVNWLVAYPVSGMGEALPPYFSWITLAHLRALPVGERVAFEAFADELIEATGIEWGASDIEIADSLLRGGLRNIVIDVVADFDGVELHYQSEPLGKSVVQKLEAFTVTPFGETLLDTAAAVRAGLQPQWHVETGMPPLGRALIVQRFDRETWAFEFPRLSPEIHELFYETTDMWHEGYIAEAEIAYRRIVSDFPEFIDVYHHLAMLLGYTGREDEAHQVWETVVAAGMKRMPKRLRQGRDQLPWLILENRPFLRVCHGLALAHLERDKVDRALELFERILAWNPNDNQGVRGLVIDIYFRQNEPERVLEVCERYPDDAMEQVLYGRALALYQLGRKAEAEAALCQAVEWLPLVAEELTKVHHAPPEDLNPNFVTHGGPDQAYLYWEEQGEHWEETPGAIEFVEACLQKMEGGEDS